MKLLMGNVLLQVALLANPAPHYRLVFLCEKRARGVTGSTRCGSHRSFRQDVDVSGGV